MAIGPWEGYAVIGVGACCSAFAGNKVWLRIIGGLLVVGGLIILALN